MLVGMLKNSSLYNPRPHKNPVGVKNRRRNIVLSQMKKYSFITDTLYDSLVKTPIVLDFKKASHNEGLAPYFREYLREKMKKWCSTKIKPDGSRYNLYTDGLKIYTTIDSRLQKFAEERINQHMPRLQKEFFKQNDIENNPTAPFSELTEGAIDTLLRRAMKRSERWRKMKYDLKKSNKEIIKSFKKPVSMKIFSWTAKNNEIDTVMTPLDSMRYYKSFLRAGMMSMEPQTGHVKAWVGGVNYKHFQYDMVKQGKRQVGSTFKPFVYAAASYIYLHVILFQTVNFV